MSFSFFVTMWASNASAHTGATNTRPHAWTHSPQTEFDSRTATQHHFAHRAESTLCLESQTCLITLTSACIQKVSQRSLITFRSKAITQRSPGSGNCLREKVVLHPMKLALKLTVYGIFQAAAEIATGTLHSCRMANYLISLKTVTGPISPLISSLIL